MRRFSQRAQLVTLSEINITPLLDLAFVLLIIFVITTPLLEQGMNLTLPTAGDNRPDNRKLDPKDIRTVEVNSAGQYMLSKQILSLNDITAKLREEHRRNPRLVVDLRGDARAEFKHVAVIFDRLTSAGIDQVSIRMNPPGRTP